MYIKSPNAKILICDEKVILCNIRNGGFVKTSKAYFEYLEMYLDEYGGKINVEDQDNTVKKNTYKLFQELCKIYFYIPVYISDKLTILHGQSDHLSRRFRSLISERDSRRSKSFL